MRKKVKTWSSMVPKGVRGYKRSRAEMYQIEEKVRVLMYNENPIYVDKQILATLKIREPITGINQRSGMKMNPRENRKGL
jgi:hypothetical protein